MNVADLIRDIAAYAAVRKIPLALCSAIWDDYNRSRPRRPSFGTAGTFLHSPPMVESSARS